MLPGSTALTTNFYFPVCMLMLFSIKRLWHNKCLSRWSSAKKIGVREHLEPLTRLSATVHGRCPVGALSATNFVPDKIVIKYFLNSLCLFWSHSFG